jgi:hypothetical protein
MASIASDVRSWIVATIAVFVMVLAFCAPSAKAEPVLITGDNTRLEVNLSNFVKLLGDGIFITAIPPAHLEFGSNPAAVFPVNNGGLFDVENNLSAVTHAGGLRIEKSSINMAVDVTNITLQCTGVTGCRLLGTANQVLPNEVAEVVDITVSDDEAGTITFAGRALVGAAGALALNTLFQTDVFEAGMELGLLTSTLTYEVMTEADAYVRPRAASPVSVSLVPAFQECTSPNRQHGPPLDSPSCNPPVQSSPNVTVGAPDANGELANATASMRFSAVPGIPATTTVDEADVRIRVNATDVRDTAAGLPDYTGELQAQVNLRLTNRNNSLLAPIFPYNEPATVQDTPLSMTVPCSTTASNTIGSSCSLATTVDSLVPGTVIESKRTVWELGRVTLLDGGADDDAETAPNAVFATQGVFVP